jgi:hypothetical protein
MELEPNFSRLSFDMNLNEFNRRPQSDNPANGNYTSVVSTLSEPVVELTANTFLANASLPNHFIGDGSNSTSLPSFFEGNALSTDNFMVAGAENFWREIEQEFLPFKSDSSTCPNWSEVLIPSSQDASLRHWSNSPPLDASYLLSQNSTYSDITLPECGYERLGLLDPLRMGCQLLDYTDVQPVPMSQDALGEYNLTRCLDYTCSNVGGINTGYTQLDGPASPVVGYSDHIGDPALCVRPEVLTLHSSYRLPSSLPSHPKRRTTDKEHERLTRVNVDNLNVPASRPTPTFNDLIVNFDLNPKPPLSKRKRSSFTRAGKEKVRLVRDWGACTFCRSRKVSVGDIFSVSPGLAHSDFC